jgi:hypothetical protein
MATNLVLDVQTFGAIGDGVTNDAAAINSAAASAATSGRAVYFPAGAYNITDMITTPARFTFAEGAKIDSSNGSALQLDNGYNAGLYQVFGAGVDVRIRYWTMDVLYFEHFGARVLTDPRTGINDSTAAIQKLFRSLQGVHYPPGPATNRPAVYNSFTVRLLGIYGISDEIKINPGGYHIGGSGVGLLGSGFKWVGPDVEANETKAMLRLFGPQWAEIDGLIFLGLPTETNEYRLYAGVALQSTGNVPPPFYGEFGRRTTIRRCTFSDTVGAFNQNLQPEEYQFQHGIITDGDNGNDDFHVFETCVIAGAEYGITIGNQQNVDTQIRNCGIGSVKTAGVWQRNGGDLFIDGLYVYNLGAGASFFKVGDPVSQQGAPNSRITMRLVGGEVNNAATSFVHNAYAFTTALFWDLTRCEITLASPNTLFLSGTTCTYTMTFDNCDITGRFRLSEDTPNHRNMITFRGCRNLQGVTVENDTSYALLDVDVQNCMGQQFFAGPTALSNMGRYVGGISYKKRFSQMNAGVALALDDPSLYATTSTLSDKVGIGNAVFGFESELGYKTYRFETRSQFGLRLAQLIPPRSVVFGCQIASLDSNLLANSNNTLSRVYVGDDEDYRRYGSLPGPNGFAASSVTDRFTPFVTASARDVVLSGAWEIDGQTWIWSGSTVTNNHGLLSADMVGNRIRFTSGPLAGGETTITAFIDSTTLSVADSRSGSGEAVMFIPFSAGKKLLIAPAYFQMMSNSPILASGVRQNLWYAEPITPV